jgi:hypothetical protein
MAQLCWFRCTEYSGNSKLDQLPQAMAGQLGMISRAVLQSGSDARVETPESVSDSSAATTIRLMPGGEFPQLGGTWVNRN